MRSHPQITHLLTFITVLMNHTTFGFGMSCDIKISEEEETIVSMCMLLFGSACGFHSWCEWDRGHKIHLKRAACPIANPQRTTDCYQPHALNRAPYHRSKPSDWLIVILKEIMWVSFQYNAGVTSLPCSQQSTTENHFNNFSFINLPGSFFFFYFVMLMKNVCISNLSV